jgi:transcriptional regulator with XRE-family HTH domain
MEISTALRKAAKAEGWEAIDIAALCRASECQVNRWLDGRSRPGADRVIAIQRASRTFRDLTLGEPGEQAA